MTHRHLYLFFALTFAISWGIPGLMLLASQFFPMLPFSLAMYSPLYYVGVWGPALAALIVIGAVQGRTGLRVFLARMLDWRFPVRWWLFALLVIPALYFLAALGHWIAGEEAVMAGWNLSLLYLLGSTVARATAGPVEELGWRGFALPLLQRSLHPVSVVLLLALVHSLWHAPVFLIGQFAHFGVELPFVWALLRFTVQILAITVIFSIAYNASGGSLTLAFLIHLMLNLAYPWKEGVDLLTGQTVLLSITALVMIASVGHRWLRREGVATAIVPGMPEPAPRRAGHRMRRGG